jgi:hypothetical protein
MLQSTPLRRPTSSSVPKPGTSPLGHVRTSSIGIRVSHVQLAAYVPCCVPPRGPTRHAAHFCPHFVYPGILPGRSPIIKLLQGSARLTLEFFADGLPEKKLQLSGISMLLILLSRGDVTKLLLEQIIPNFEEVRKWRVAPNDGAHVLEALVQPPKNVEDEDPIVNGCVEVGQTVGHGLELAAVLIDRKVTLNKSMKNSIM